MAESYVLDSYAILAYLFGEEGGDKVEETLLAAESGKTNLYLNLINLGETYYIIHRKKDEAIANRTIAMVKSWPLEIISPDERMTLMAARVKAKHPISYADAFAVVTGITRDAAVITGDPEMESVENLVKIFWIRK